MHDKQTPDVKGKPSGFRSHVGYETLAWRDGYAEILLVLGPEHGNSYGAVHGGVYMTVMDAAMGHATTWCTVKGNRRVVVTMSLTTSFLAPARGPTIRAVARLVSIENRVAHCRGEIFDENGALLVVAQGSFRYFPGSERTEGVPQERSDGSQA